MKNNGKKVKAQNEINKLSNKYNINRVYMKIVAEVGVIFGVITSYNLYMTDNKVTSLVVCAIFLIIGMIMLIGRIINSIKRTGR